MEGNPARLQQKIVSVIALSFLLFNHVFSQSTYGWVNIDCGAETNYKDSNGIDWKTDGAYTNSGENKPVTHNGLAVSDQMGTLRFFKFPKKNCYFLPSPDKLKYLIRAGFFYGNYDGLGKPPTFDLVFDTNKWVTVITSMEEPLVYEMVYAAKGDTIDICISQTQVDQLPFISSLEAIPLTNDMYDKMNRNYAWFLSYRVHFGGSNIIGYPDDDYNRIWKPFPTPGLTNVTANFSDFTNDCADDPPFSAIGQAVEATNAKNSISLSLNFTETSRSNYLSLYFTEVNQLSADDKRSFNIAIDGHDYGLIITPQYQICNEVNVTTDPASGPMNISISPIDGSTLPPLISAAEVYTVSPTLAGGTDPADLDGIGTLKDKFSQLKLWTGDPCLPNNTVWEWLSCNANDPPRVTALYLSGYGLGGFIPTINQMQSLEIIYMDSNNLQGEIPEYLGTMPNLRELNLAYNNLEGDIPQTLIDNKKVSLNVTGNPQLNQKAQKEGKARKAFRALWSLLSLVLIGYCIKWCCCTSDGGSTAHEVPVAVVTGVPVAPPAPAIPVAYVETSTTVTMGYQR